MVDLSNAGLALFFTLGMSVKGWHDAGLIQRDSLLYERLCAQGYDIHFITYGSHDDHQYLYPGSRIRVLAKPNGLTDHQYGWRVPSIHRDVLRDVDIIKSHQVFGARFAVLAKLRLGKPYVARCGYLRTVFLKRQNRSRREQLLAWLEECLAFRLADAVCAPSQAEIRYISRRYGVDPAKAHACPNWIDTERFKPDPAVLKQTRRVCFVARFDPAKQPLLLLEAFRGLKDIELLMIGGGSLRGQIEAKIREYDLNATILDRVPNETLPAYLNSSAVYVLPTLYEGGSPKTLLEAMACGLPVVSTNAFGVNEAFQHKTHGYKLAPDNVQALREAVLTLLDDPVRAKVMGQQGRQHVIDNYSVERAIGRELDILRRLIAANCG